MCANRADVSGERLQKVMARAGVASRRKCEALIAAGRVRVNGAVVTEMGTRVDPASDTIAVDGREIQTGRERAYYLLYKPVGYLSTARDPDGRRTVVDLVATDRRLFPVGRLDAESEGLLLLTDDGELMERLLHPKYGHTREYLVLVRGQVSADDMGQMAKGLTLDGEEYPARAIVHPLPEVWTWRGHRAAKDQQWLRVVLRQGLKRQIRRMMAMLGLEVKRLVRVRMAGLEIGALEPGRGRWLTRDEVGALLSRAEMEE